MFSELNHRCALAVINRQVNIKLISKAAPRSAALLLHLQQRQLSITIILSEDRKIRRDKSQTCQKQSAVQVIFMNDYSSMYVCMYLYRMYDAPYVASDSFARKVYQLANCNCRQY